MRIAMSAEWIEIRNAGLVYCKHKSSNTSSCGNVATRRVKLCRRKCDAPADGEAAVTSYRCEHHAAAGTGGYRIFESEAFDQSAALRKVNNFLDSLIGKTIQSTVHTAKGLVVKYKKPNGGVMCFQPVTEKWKFVYYHQVKDVRITVKNGGG